MKKQKTEIDKNSITAKNIIHHERMKFMNSLTNEQKNRFRETFRAFLNFFVFVFFGSTFVVHLQSKIGACDNGWEQLFNNNDCK
jgi:NhaP-type Na+/H+ or K+/H+ antiporter